MLFTGHGLVRLALSTAFLFLLQPIIGRGELLVSDNFGSQVLRFNENTGEFLDTLVPSRSGGLDGAIGMQIGPDGLLWVASQNNNSVLRFDAETGDPVDVFADNDITPNAMLQGPSDLRFGADGSLFVGNFSGTTVDRFDSETGEALGPFTQGGPLNGASFFLFGPDGNLYVSSFNTNQVLRYDGTTGEFLDVAAEENGLSGPAGLAFQDDSLLVASLLGQEVLRFDAESGAFIDVFATPAPGGEMGEFPPFPSDLLFLDEQRMLVSFTGLAGIGAFDRESGQQLPYFATAPTLQVPGRMLLLPALVAGDANGDGMVNLDDFNILKANFGGMGSRADGDFDGTGIVDLADFNILKANFGASASDAANVPEPTSACLCLIGLISLAIGIVRSRRGQSKT